MHQAAKAQVAVLPCYLVNNLTRNSEEQCKFIVDNECLEREAALDYARLVFCDFSHELRWLAILLVLTLVVILFLNLSAVANEFLCPNLLTVAKNLHMSDNLAGVTLLAFGNGCPDIFSSLAAASSGRPEIIVGELLGAGIFCTSIVAGLIFIHSDFKLARRPLLRDATFYLLAVFLMWLYCFQGRITFYGSLAFIIIYVIYLFFALSGQAIHSRVRGEYPIAEEIERHAEKHKLELGQQRAKLTQQKELEWREESLRRGSLVKWSECCKSNDKNTLVLSDNKNTIRISYQNPGERPATSIWICEPSAEKANIGKESTTPIEEKVTTTTNLPAVLLAASPPPVVVGERRHLTLDEFWQFLEHICPISLTDWAEANLLDKAILILRAPLLLVTLLTVPVVNRDKKDNNWNRLLNSLHCATIPIAVIVLLRLGSADDDLDDNINNDLDFDDDDLKGRNESELHQGQLPATPANTNNLLLHYSYLTYLTYLTSFVPIQYLLVSPALVLVLFVFYSTSAQKTPRLHAAYSYFGFAMSVMWIYTLATEIISILKTVGIIFSMTDTAIGLGVLAWGNSLGDIVANLTLAESGHARMALGASIGAPLLNLLLGFGLSFSLSLKPGGSIGIEYSPTTVLLVTTLALVLILLMLSTLAPGNKSKRPFGYLLISCYGVYFALAVCFECKLINF